MSSSDSTCVTAPASMADCGMPPTTQLSGVCTTTGRPRSANFRAPLVPSQPIPVSSTASGASQTRSTDSNSTSAFG